MSFFGLNRQFLANAGSVTEGGRSQEYQMGVNRTPFNDYDI
jgi:hypothetical protein